MIKIVPKTFRRGAIMRYLTVVGLIFIYGCNTGYEKDGLFGGYSDMRIQGNIYRVSFRGNGFTNFQRASDLALLRCADLTLEQGGKYFSVVDSAFSTETYTTPVTSHTSGTANISGGTATYSGNTTYSGGQTYYKPLTTFVIEVFTEKPQQAVYDAQQVRANIRNAYNIKD
jgi:hypothetical protein